MGFCWQHKFAPGFQCEWGAPTRSERPSSLTVMWHRMSFLAFSCCPRRQEEAPSVTSLQVPWLLLTALPHCRTPMATGVAEWLFLISASCQADYCNPAFPRTHHLFLTNKLVCQLPTASLRPSRLSQNIFVSLHCLPCLLRIITVYLIMATTKSLL